MLISHDRAFLRRLARATLWLDRGELRRQDKGFDAFEAWRDEIWEQEDAARHKLDRKIKEEARWAVEGISARRKRNQGRVRALAELRRERAEQIRRQGTAALALDAAPGSGAQGDRGRGDFEELRRQGDLPPVLAADAARRPASRWSGRTASASPRCCGC